MTSENANELQILNICCNCIGESHLSELMETEGKRRKCNYCGERVKSVKLDALADHIESAFYQHYERTDRDPDGIQWAMMKDKEIDYDWDREGESAIWAICGAADVSEEIATDLQIVLERVTFN